MGCYEDQRHNKPRLSCCWVNHAGVTAFRHRREEAKAAVKQENIARLEARLVAKERKGEEKAEREKRKLEKMAAKEAKASKQQKKVVLKAIARLVWENGCLFDPIAMGKKHKEAEEARHMTVARRKNNFNYCYNT